MGVSDYAQLYHLKAVSPMKSILNELEISH